jgi:CRISPR-associated endonuclease/helicase Cas3
MEMKIRTRPVFSKLADAVPPEIAARLPSGWQLSQHQVETYRALTGGEYDVIFNTAMTGDGKSLAGQLPTLLDFGNKPLFAMYPTNELIRDQEKQIRQARQQWHSQLLPAPLDSAELDRLMDSDDFGKRGEALLNLIYNNDVLLTNPDIFHYIMEHFYRRPRDAADKIIGPLVDKFSQFTLDEFHIFETPQVISVINAMLFIKEITGVHAPRFLFLSATPEAQMLAFLDRAGLRYLNLDPAQQGWYAHRADPPAETYWRRILHGTDIHFATGGVEEWIKAHLQDMLLPFFKDNHPQAKGAVILNSIAAAMRLTDTLQPIFAQHGLTVKPNTGLTSRAGRAESYEADLLIGTSTVDVGVDFNINFLLFESLNAGTFLQRLGRLGRHSGYSRSGRTHTFEKFEAHALVPPWIAETLFQGRDRQPALLKPGDTITRHQLTQAIGSAYPPPATFGGYVQDWGKFQSLKVIATLNKSAPTRSQYAATRDRLGHLYQQTFEINLRGAYGHRRALQEAGTEVLLNEALSFRGGSYFQCAILDETEKGQPKLYDLFSLAANGRLAPLDQAEFYRVVAQAGLSKRPFDQANGPQKGPLGYFRLQGWRTEREDYRLYLQQDLSGWGSDKFGQALVIEGWEIDAATLSQVNKRLRPRHLPATLCLAYSHPLELKRRLYLPPLFPVYAFTSRDGVSGCVAFGREALLLHTKIQRRSDIECGGGAMIF